ncbi:hypothetical protein ES332_A05G080300v1 [Gossypium tomentosum]|uniref:Uncharacterized protein n=1 Tax=Gossypium tomentosum TaxID=34277 RepID=A0A5D2QBP7_GOSTO|nr:hypothetical protein ES332_A05G080300v1 [Gossypium tomentosum]
MHLPSSSPNQWYFAQRLHTKFKQCKGIIIELIHFSFIFLVFPSNLISVPLLYVPVIYFSALINI